MLTNRKQLTNIGRSPFNFSKDIDLEVKDRVKIVYSDTFSFEATYLGQSKLSPLPMERFHTKEELLLPINSALEVFAGKRKVGDFMLATIRTDENTFILIKKENLPCPE